MIMLFCLCLHCLLVRFSTGQMRSPDHASAMIANDPEVTAIRTSADDETDETDATKQTEANMDRILKNLSIGMPAGGMLTTKRMLKRIIIL